MILGDLRDRTALVTGAGSPGGMGATIAEVLARHGARVAVSDVDLTGARAVAAGIAGGGAVPLPLDVTSAASVAAGVAEAIAALGRIDVLVCNAGVGAGNDEAGWQRAFDVNVRGAVRCCEAVLPAMRERRSGKIVCIASISGHTARGAGGAYGASKAALLRYAKGLAVEVGPFSINVNAVCPGGVWTGLQASGFARPAEVDPTLAGLTPYEAFVEYYRRITPLGRVQSAEDVAKAVAFLASDDAANITGQCLHVDGGLIRD